MKPLSTADRILSGNYPQEQKHGIFLIKKNFCDEVKITDERRTSRIVVSTREHGREVKTSNHHVFQ